MSTAELPAHWRQTRTHLVTEAFCVDCGVGIEDNLSAQQGTPQDE